MSYIPLIGTVQLLFIGRALNFQSTADQALTKSYIGTKCAVTNVYATRVSGGASVACAGGVYDTASKAGLPLVAAVQSWVALTGAAKMVAATVANLLGTDVSSTGAAFLSLTTGSTAAVTGDLFIYGVVLD